MDLHPNPEPLWLKRLQADMFRITTAAAREHWPGPAVKDPPYYNYRLAHVRQVVRDGTRLQAAVGGDWEVLMAAIWIHDRFQPQYEGPEHARQAAAWAAKTLAGYRFPAEKVPAVAYAVAHHSNPPGTIPAESHEARLLWDADKLSKLGATSVAAFFCAHPAFPERPVTFETMARVGLAQLAKSRELLGAYYFPLAQAWARRRYEAEAAYWHALAGELGLEAGGEALRWGEENARIDEG